MSRSACAELVEYSVSVSLTHLSMDVETGISVGRREIGGKSESEREIDTRRKREEEIENECGEIGE